VVSLDGEMEVNQQILDFESYIVTGWTLDNFQWSFSDAFANGIL
jgi:hypothetical protein